MKGKGYRSSSVKAIWIVIAHLAAVAAAVCAAMFVMIYQTGIRLDDRGKSYTESEAFEKQVSNRGSDILVSLAAQDDINYLKNAGSSAVIDLAEFEEKGNTRDSIRDLSLKNTSGLAYSVSDLLEWGKDWEANYYEGVYDEDSQVIRCESSDGTSHYFYRTDFKKMVADGTLKINYNTDFLEEDDFESKTESEKLDTVADELYYRYTSQSENIGNVTDTRTNTEYPGCFFVELSQLDEKFAPQGAENILDAVNKSTEWNGRLEDAYKELFTLLDCIRAIQSDEQFNDYETSLASVFHSVGDYTEGSTNLTYLFADKETQTIYTNKKAYSSYAQLEQNLEKIFKEKAYAVVYPELSECVTNIPDADLQVWNHTIDQSFDTKDFVFAVSVDTKFSVADSMADEAENYETYSKLMFPMLAGAIFGSVLWLIGMVWLTVTAGRKPKDEEIHLNGFDRWYTEIAAGAVIGIWLAGTIISGTLIANSSLGYSHAVVTVIVTCLICGTYTMAWFLIGYLSLVRRIKAGTLWKNSLIRTVLKWIGKCSGKLADFARAFSRNTAEKIKVLLVGGAFLFLQFLIIGCGFTGAGVFLIILLIVDAAAVIFIIRKADGLDLIMDGLKKISDGEVRKAMDGCGIGTPATRANILETLLLREYIRREKKTLVPTDKGMAVYDIVKDKRIANAEMTGMWELALAKIENGENDAARFNQEIKDYTGQICTELLESSIVSKDNTELLTCPVCKNNSVKIYPKVAKCTSEGCEFRIFREVCGKMLTDKDVRSLITQGHTSMLKGLVSKAGKKFNAVLILKEDGSTSFEFKNNK